MPSIEPSVDVLIEGIVVLDVERDNAGNVVAFVAGAVPDVPNHKVTLVGRKIPQSGPPQDFNFDPAPQDLRLEAEGTTQPGIRFAALNEQIDRIAGKGAPESFNWVLNFSGQELHRKQVPVDPTKFLSIFRITSGELFTKVISRNHLLTSNAEDPNDPLTLVGKVATEVGAAINLDTPQSVARLFDGANEIVSVHPGERLILEFRNTCPHDPNVAGLRQAHANHYYNALVVEKPEQKDFSSTKFLNPTPASPPASPEASCYVGRVNP